MIAVAIYSPMLESYRRLLASVEGRITENQLENNILAGSISASSGIILLS